MRLMQQSELRLEDWQQAGFRPGKGCRDNTFILRALIQRVMQLGRNITLTFIGYSVAFDTVSHTFLDDALRRAGRCIKQNQSDVQDRLQLGLNFYYSFGHGWKKGEVRHIPD